mmetsp:Transcript_50776/g.91191  ORF Transcript_50776/g.91191 Transcript_50776/m.91191 type:complete len:205 (-) Transcript_50776:84-698(-)|eukprot:CAMPEP_0197653356 /NCGR_PEP_ID=MMETSP1338-20131121/35216_1 /TAXON_ID=43686 ORGANISM="Pelagodinium beii, Strain RCC1491" /NCGR_SAMPLE_ID=MMETSP1338 /ASSEMBLY_ACC=CAM_ASM_000754 /LENGTH=204 /DNA_ID=CAMNT_0043228435 /DNA_START=66 /DNA_END=680 /DNA_ORIENTATION=+
MVLSLRSMWGETRTDEAEEASTSVFARIRPWFILLLMVQATLLIVRWQTGDAHGSLLMLSVFAVGVLALTAGVGDVDSVYGGYFGLMSFVSGVLDLNMAIEHLLWRQWKHWHEGLTKGTLALSLAKPGLYLACAVAQLASAYVAYILYKESDSFEDDLDEPLFATAEQARIYNAVLQHSDRSAASRAASQDPMKSFVGTAHKLP